MQNIRTQISQIEVLELTKFLLDENRPEDTLCFQEVQGFLFAVACSPELIPTSDWLPIISNDEDIGFKDQLECSHILDLIVALYNQINIGVLERSNRMPLGCEFQEDIEANLDEQVEISQWSRGFMLGYDCLSDLWDQFVPESLDNELGSCALILSFFSSRRLAEAYYLDATTSPKHRKPGLSFDEFAEKVRDLFPDALASFAHLGRTISEALEGTPERGS